MNEIFDSRKSAFFSHFSPPLFHIGKKL